MQSCLGKTLDLPDSKFSFRHGQTDFGKRDKLLLESKIVDFEYHSQIPIH